MSDETPDIESEPRTSNDVLLDACTELLDGMITSAVLVVKLINDEGKNCFMAVATDNTPPWDVVGMLEYGSHMARLNTSYEEEE